MRQSLEGIGLTLRNQRKVVHRSGYVSGHLAQIACLMGEFIEIGFGRSAHGGPGYLKWE
jgi:hypothetical protein